MMRYHIVPGTFITEFLSGSDMSYTTAAGASLNLNGTSGLQVNRAAVVTADLSASNGVVPIINRLLSPR